MFWFIQVSAVSLMIIFVLHHLYSFFKETLTVPKIKDMVKRPQQKYEVLFRELRNQVVEQEQQSTFSTSISNSNSNDDMKNELKRYLMDLNSSSHAPPQPQPQPHPQPQPQSDFIELGSTYR